MKTRQSVTFGLAPWSVDGKAPKRFRLFRFGENRSTKGTVFLTRESAKKCLSAWIDYGNDLSGDYNHAITNPNIESPRASCWFSLSIEADGLYANNVSWTEAASKAIEAKEYRYYSPYFITETDKHNRPCVVEIINVALTNTPATKNQRPLVALSRLAWSYLKMFDDMMIEKLKELLKEGGVAEEKSADLILKLQNVLCPKAEPEEAPMMDGVPLAKEEDKKEEMPMSDLQSYKKAFTLLEQKYSGMEKLLKQLVEEKKENEKQEKENLFNQFKKEGRLANVKEQDAKDLLNSNFVMFKRLFGAIQPINAVAPKAPELKTVSEISKDENVGLVAPAFSNEQVKAYMDQHKTDFKTSLMALSRVAKGK